MKQSSPTYLKHHFLIAMPHMADPNFAQTVTYLVEHNEQGAMGLVINRPSGLNLAEVLEQLKPDALPPARCQHIEIYNGGPVQTDRGFVLHPSGLAYQSTLELGELAMSTSQDVLFAIAAGTGPEKSLISLGYAGWEAGQLETELSDNAWLTCPAEPPQPAHRPGRTRLMAADKPLRLLLGFDYGTRQIGVAVGQAVTGQARELCVLKAQNGVPDWNRVEALIKEWQPDAIVVGLPLNMDGSPSEMSERAEKFGRRLNGRFNLPVFTHDERLTTYAAKGERLAQGQRDGYRERPVDALAAALLLEGWLAEQPN
ncbi:YqgE/AlgH family protein [Pseudomonas aeruginosa]|nr:YqgE/AlgH family protein [Pseudomonas aeruginosa]